MARKCARMTSVAATFLVTVAGCSFVTDLDGFTSASPDAGASTNADSGAPTTGPDGSTDAASPAANTDSATPPGPLCDGTHFFCTDFDKRALPQEWELVAPGDGTIERKEGASLSPPFALEVTHPIGNPGGTPIVATTLPAAGIGGLTCTFAYRRDEVDDAGVLVVLMVDFNTTGTEHFFAEIKDGLKEGRLYVNATAPDGTGKDDFPVIPTFASPTLGAWSQVEWTLDLRALRTTLTSNGKRIDQRPFGAFTPANLTTIKLSLGLGNFAPPNAPWRVRFDNFVCDALP